MGSYGRNSGRGDPIILFPTVLLELKLNTVDKKHEFHENHHSVTSYFIQKKLQTMLWHHNARVNSHQRWKQTRFRVCFHLWCEFTSTMSVTEWQGSWNSCNACWVWILWQLNQMPEIWTWQTQTNMSKTTWAVSVEKKWETVQNWYVTPLRIPHAAQWS